MKTGRRIDVLYIRSHNNLVADSIVPLGAITSMNAAPGTKLGVYASECTEAQIRMARMVAVDWHWCFSLPAVRAICEKVRRIHPQVPIVIGGLTAGLFGNKTFELLSADYLLSADTEPAFAALVAGERNITKLPNTLDSTGRSGPQRRITQEEFDGLDPLTVDWFPSFNRNSRRNIFLSRGCDNRCGNHCLCRTIGENAMIHSPSWMHRVIRSPGSSWKSLGIWAMGVSDVNRLIGIFDQVGPPVNLPVSFYC